MAITVYEHLTELGLGRDPADPLHSLYCEGLAMRQALEADLTGLAEATGIIVIAPETDGVLLELRHRFGDRWLGCSEEAIALTSDKLALAEHWRKNGVQTPAATDREPTPCEAFPVVWKPRDGCGSTATFLLKDHFDLARAKALLRKEHSGPMILQEFVQGRAVSLTFLCGPKAKFPLIPTFQTLSTDGRFHYLGGELPTPPDLAARAIELGTRAVGCVPGLCGWVGVDMILGDAADWAIEINPRMTTSYIGLRALAEFNLAAEWVRIARGGSAGELHWKRGRVRFTPEGIAEEQSSW